MAAAAETLHIPCGNCMAVNRVNRTRESPTCGRCKSRLFPDRPTALSDASFTQFVERADLPVLVDFWATWCGPCRSMAPQFEAAAKDHRGDVLFAKLDTDAAPQTAAKFGIRSIPTVIAFAGGREISRQSGAMSRAQISEWLQSVRR